MNYNDILNEEYAKAMQDVANAKYHNTFHRGIFGYMKGKGWTVTSFGDSTIYFYGASRLFRFYANHFTTDKAWTLSERVLIDFENYSWKEVYSYPYTRDCSFTEVKVSEFDKFFKNVADKISEEPKLKEYRTNRECENEYKKYIVSATYYGYGAPLPICREFDNLEDAKKFAYDYADKKCKEGRERNDSTRLYFMTYPQDCTEECPSKIYAWKYYEYDEHAYYVYIEGC